MGLVNNEFTYTPDALFAGSQIQVLTKGIELVGKQGILKRGSVIQIDANGKGILATKVGIALEVAGILTDDVETSTTLATTSIATVYETGYFNETALMVGSDATIADFKAILKKQDIFTNTVQGVE